MPLNFEDALSPAAYKIACAVWEACEADEFSDCTFDSFFPLVAAALCAAVEVVVPEKDTTSSPCREHCVIGSAPERIRRELLNIATELENTND